jgi:hypothetical protein
MEPGVDGVVVVDDEVGGSGGFDFIDVRTCRRMVAVGVPPLGGSVSAELFSVAPDSASDSFFEAGFGEDCDVSVAAMAALHEAAVGDEDAVRCGQYHA